MAENQRRRPSLRPIVPFVLISLLALSGCGQQRRDYPLAVDGILDLRGWDFMGDGPVPLSGAWEFHWNTLLSPLDADGAAMPVSDSYATVPGTWKNNEATGEKLPGTGYASYRLRIFLDEGAGKLAIRTLTASTAFTFYVNGKEVASAGKVGTTATGSKPGYKPQVAELASPEDGELDLILHISNFHYRTGGPWRHIWLGDAKELANRKWMLDVKAFFIFGCLLIMFLYHLALFLLRRRDRHFLFMAFFCLFVSLRALTTGEYGIVHLIPTLPFALLIRIEYLSFFLAVLFAHQLFQSLYPDEYYPWQTRIVHVVTLLFSALVILTPLAVFTNSIFIYYLFSFLVSMYIAVVCGIAFKRGRQGALVFLFGVLVMVGATLNDILYSSFLINTGYLADVAMIVFVFCQALVMSLRLTGAFTREESLSRQLAEMNAGLELQVEARTAELRRAYESIKELSIRDQLTGCFNRLFLNEQFPKEIDRVLRYKRSLSVIMADIDHFKKINDNFGHQAGDKVLAEIGRIIIGSMRDKIDWAFRFGGEEFVILIPETDLEGATIVAEKLRRNIAAAVVNTKAGPLSVTASFGVSGFASPPAKSEVSMTDMMNEVDKLLYQAKEAGRNRVVAAAFPVL